MSSAMGEAQEAVFVSNVVVIGTMIRVDSRQDLTHLGVLSRSGSEISAGRPTRCTSHVSGADLHL